MVVTLLLWFIGLMSFFSIFYYIFLWPARKFFIKHNIISDNGDSRIDSRMLNGEEFALWAIEKTIFIGLSIVTVVMFYAAFGILWMLTFYGRWNLPAWPGFGPN